MEIQELFLATLRGRTSSVFQNESLNFTVWLLLRHTQYIYFLTKIIKRVINISFHNDEKPLENLFKTPVLLRSESFSLLMQPPSQPIPPPALPMPSPSHHLHRRATLPKNDQNESSKKLIWDFASEPTLFLFLLKECLLENVGMGLSFNFTSYWMNFSVTNSKFGIYLKTPVFGKISHEVLYVIN